MWKRWPPSLPQACAPPWAVEGTPRGRGVQLFTRLQSKQHVVTWHAPAHGAPPPTVSMDPNVNGTKSVTDRQAVTDRRTVALTDRQTDSTTPPRPAPSALHEGRRREEPFWRHASTAHDALTSSAQHDEKNAQQRRKAVESRGGSSGSGRADGGCSLSCARRSMGSLVLGRPGVHSTAGTTTRNLHHG